MTADRRIWRLIGATVAAVLIVATLVAATVLYSNASQEPVYPRAVTAARVVPLVLLYAPALIAAIAVVRRSPVMVVVAGVISLLQSLIAFSGVTLGFLLPASLLLVLGVRVGANRRLPSTIRTKLAGVLVFGLVVSAWIVVLGTAETVCWTSDVAGGCDSGVPAIQGIVAAGGLVLAASAVAWRSAPRPSPFG